MRKRKVSYIPTLWETTVVSASSKSWNRSGFRIVLDSVEKSQPPCSAELSQKKKGGGRM